MPAERAGETPTTAGGGFRALLGAIRDYAGPRIAGLLLVVALAAVLEGAGMVLLLPVAETIFAAEGGERSGVTGEILGWLGALGVITVFGQLAVMGAGFVLLVLVRALVMLKRDVLLMQLSQGFVDHIRRDFFALLARADWPVIKRFRKAQLLNTITTNIGRLSQTMTSLSRGVVTLALAAAYLSAAFVISSALGLLLLALVGIGLLSAVLWSRRSHSLGERLTRANRGVMSETTRFLDGMKAAKAARAEEALTARFSDTIAETRSVQVTFVRQQSRLRNAIQVLAAIAALLVLLIGYGALGLSGGELLVMAAIVLRLAPSLNQIFSGMQSIAHALPAFESIRRLEAEITAASARRTVAGSATALPAPPAGVALTLKRCAVEAIDEDGAAVTLVRCGDISFGPGTLAHISGPSGAGKSSLVELVAGLHLPTGGQVLRGDFPLSPATCRAWQAEIAFAPQEPFIFDATVRENLLWPNLTADDAAIGDALEMVEAAELIRALPMGLDEPLLDGGARLSGGERQRLCLARALLRPAAILILDEATSAMDPELERRIVGRIKQRLGRGIALMVSHSMNAAEYADRRVVVDKGEARIA